MKWCVLMNRDTRSDTPLNAKSFYAIGTLDDDSISAAPHWLLLSLTRHQDR